MMRIRAIMVLASMSMSACSAIEGIGKDVNPDSTHLKPDTNGFVLTLGTRGSGKGSLAADPVRTKYPEGTSITIRPTAGDSSVFTGWYKGCTEPVVPCRLAIYSPVEVVGTFAPRDGVRRFDGDYSGAFSYPSANGQAEFELVIDNGVVSAKTVPIYGSAAAFTGSISSGGDFRATLPPGQLSTCIFSIAGTFSIGDANGIVTSEGSGNYALAKTDTLCINSQKPPGTFHVKRDLIPTNKFK